MALFRAKRSSLKRLSILPTFTSADNLTDADILSASILTKQELPNAYMELGSAICPAEILDTHNQKSALDSQDYVD
ncbi:MAG: hypothetical protein ACK4SL_00495 [Candidatus Paceibacteria bacterium]